MSKRKLNENVLVKWEGCEIWDVLHVDLAFKTELQLLKKVQKDPKSFMGKVLNFSWLMESSESAPATLIDYGKNKDLEKIRTNLIIDHYKAIGEDIPELVQEEVSGPTHLKALKFKQQSILMSKIVDGQSNRNYSEEINSGVDSRTCQCENYSKLKEKYSNLKRENKKLKETQEASREEKAVLSELKELIFELKCTKPRSSSTSIPNSTSGLGSCASPKVAPFQSTSTYNANSYFEETQEINNQNLEFFPGVSVDKASLATMLRVSSNGTKFARALFLHLFDAEDLIGASLRGRTSNAHKGATPKRALDEKKVDAVIAYTLKKFPTATRREISDSLANKIKEVNKMYAKNASF